jgi:formylmethanofuran dehydrogenase subunit E
MKVDKKQIKGLLADLLPQPIISGTKIIAGNPPEVVVRLSEKGLLIAPYRATWESPYELKVVVTNADLVGWGDLPDAVEPLRSYLSQKIEAARKTRKATFKNCSLCHETTPPERMHGETTCQACASSKQGVVY